MFHLGGAVMLNERQIQDFLFYGYVPVPADEFLSAIVSAKLSGAQRFTYTVPQTELVREGAQALSNTFSGESNYTGLQVIPLSGGFDSRAILGGLLDRGLQRDLVTLTFGTPGSWDFEIGRLVASAAGVRSEVVNLSNQVARWTTDELVDTARSISRPVWIFDKHVNRTLTRLFGEETTYWSGFMGDPLAGSHLAAAASSTWENAVQRFAAKNRFARVSLNLPDYEPVGALPSKPLLNDPLILELDEQADLGIRQGGYISEIVLQSDRKFRCPFLERPWVDFILNAPRPMRYQQRLYRDILLHKYPNLFSLPSKNLRGSSLSASRLRRTFDAVALSLQAASHGVMGKDYLKLMSTNYVDFDAAIRRVVEFQDLVRTNLCDLQHRRLVTWIDIQGLLTAHLAGRANLGRELTLLTSLEIFLKSR